MKIKITTIKRLIFYCLVTLAIFSCCSKIENESMAGDKGLQKQVIESVPRGIIEATLIPNEIIEIDKRNICKATINTVHRTGGGIRPIAEKTDYSIEVNQNILEEIKNYIGKPIRCQIAEIPGWMGSGKSKNYKIIRILK